MRDLSLRDDLVFEDLVAGGWRGVLKGEAAVCASDGVRGDRERALSRGVKGGDRLRSGRGGEGGLHLFFDLLVFGVKSEMW